MEKWLEKIYKNWKKYIKVFLIWIIIFLLVIHLLFKIKLGIYWLEAEWSAGDMISFVSSLLSFIGTIVLGCITTKVSIDNNNINQKLVEIENRRELLEKDKRLGYVFFEKIEIRYYQKTEEVLGNGRKAYGIMELQTLTEETESIDFRIRMILTSDSIINKLTRKVIKLCYKGFSDDYEKNISHFGWISFYVNERKVPLGIEQKEKKFEDIFLLAEYDREPEYFYKLKQIMTLKGEYLIYLEYEYSNTMNEKRNIAIQVTCRNEYVIKSEIINLE